MWILIQTHQTAQRTHSQTRVRINSQMITIFSHGHVSCCFDTTVLDIGINCLLVAMVMVSLGAGGSRLELPGSRCFPLLHPNRTTLPPPTGQSALLFASYLAVSKCPDTAQHHSSLQLTMCSLHNFCTLDFRSPIENITS